MRNLHNWDVAEPVHCIIFSIHRSLGICFVYTGITFFKAFVAILFSLNLYTSWQPRHSIVSSCLIQCLTKNRFIFVTLFASEKNLGLVLSSPKLIGNLLSMNSRHSDKNSFLTSWEPTIGSRFLATNWEWGTYGGEGGGFKMGGFKIILICFLLCEFFLFF